MRLPSIHWLTQDMQACNVKSSALQAYYRVYKEHIPVAQLCRETAAVMQEFTRAAPSTCDPAIMIDFTRASSEGLITTCWHCATSNA